MAEALTSTSGCRDAALIAATMPRVPTTRLSRISRLRCSFQRWPAIDAPARFTTAQAPSMEEAQGPVSDGVHRTYSAAPGTARRAESGRRVKTTISYPFSASFLHSSLPISPVAPVTTTRLALATAHLASPRLWSWRVTPYDRHYIPDGDEGRGAQQPGSPGCPQHEAR